MSENIMPFVPVRSLMSVDPAAVAAGEAVKARIQAAYLMSIHNPRNIDEARVRILKFCESPEFAETVEYSKPIGNTKIKGLSIRFAEVALSTFRNILTEAQLLYEDDNIKRIRISALDLEGNTQFSRDISIKKTVERKSIKGREDDVISQRQNSYNQTVYLVRATEDEVMTKESAYVSKFIRTEGLRLLPADIKNEAIAKSRETLSKRDKEDPAAAKKRILDAFSRINIWPKDLEKYIGHTVDTISPAEIADLRTVYSAIESGEATWADYTTKPESITVDRKETKKTATQTEKDDPASESKVESDNQFKTPAAFIQMIKDQTGKDYIFTPSVEGLPHDLLSLYLEITSNNNNMSPAEMMDEVSKQGVFPGFWNGFVGGTWKKHYTGKLPSETGAVAKEPPSSSTDTNDKSTNPFNVVDWKANALKKVGLQRYWDTNKNEWAGASDRTRSEFKDKWIRVFTDDNVLTRVFPGGDKEKESKDKPINESAAMVPETSLQATKTADFATDDEKTKKIDYQKEFVEIQLKDPEGLMKACEIFGYGAQIVIPMSEKPRKELYETYLSLKKAESIG